MKRKAGSPQLCLPGWFAAGSLVAIALGALTMAEHDVPPVRWGLNLVGWAMGGAIASTMTAAEHRKPWLVMACVTGAVIMLASLAGPGQMDVHRWLAIGPLTINAAALTLPAVIVAMARLSATSMIGQACAVIIGMVLAAQPDSSQSIAFTAASLILFLQARHWRSSGLCALLVLVSAIALIRPDPLQPVPEVEQIVSLAWGISAMLAAAMVLSLAATAILPLLLQPANRAAQALSAYMMIIMLAPLWGWFPIPLAGAGMSFPLGLWLGIGLLAATLKSEKTQ